MVVLAPAPSRPTTNRVSVVYERSNMMLTTTPRTTTTTPMMEEVVVVLVEGPVEVCNNDDHDDDGDDDDVGKTLARRKFVSLLARRFLHSCFCCWQKIDAIGGFVRTRIPTRQRLCSS